MRLSLIILIAILLNGCVSNPIETQAKFDKKSETDLCMDYLYYDWMNVYQKYRAEAIRKKQIDCRPYIEMAAIKYKKDKIALQNLYNAIDTLK